MNEAIKNKNPDGSLFYIGMFFVTVLITYWVGGYKPTFWFLVTVLLGILFSNLNKYRVTFETPEIFSQN